MAYTHGTSKNSPIRICTKCGREFPNANEYFCYASKKDNRLESMCKECKSKRSKERSSNIKKKNKELSLFYEGTKHCPKCNRDLPNNRIYFPVDLGCKDGLRNICRECNPNYGNFVSEDYVPNDKWTDEELILLKQVYHDYTNEELQKKFFPNRTIHAIDIKAFKDGFAWKTDEAYARSKKQMGEKVSLKLKGHKVSDETKMILSESRKRYYETHEPWAKGKHFSKEHCENISKSKKKIGQWVGNKNPRHKNPLNGSDNPNWQGGLTNIYQELRSDTKDWFNESAKFCNYSCVITGNNFDNVHHTTSFKNIFNETFRLIDIDKRKNVSDYSVEEFDTLTDTLKYLHELYGYGACITKEVHKLFHDSYGYVNFSPYDFLDFVHRIENGEYNAWFNENGLDININYEYIEYLESTLLSLERSA